MKDDRLAVLIDADNIPSGPVKEMMEEIAKFGTPTIKRIYGDFTSTRLSKWKSELLENAITPMQQYSYTTGKNATDSAMIISAMDILYADKVDGFCLVSSDSDFTGLAVRLREAGKTVIGIGETKTPQPFIAACDKFIYIENLQKEKISTPKSKAAGTNVDVAKIVAKKLDEPTKRLIRESVDDIADEAGWTNLGHLGNFILKRKKDFDPRTYGFAKLLALIRNTGDYEIDEREAGVGNVRHVYVRVRE